MPLTEPDRAMIGHFSDVTVTRSYVGQQKGEGHLGAIYDSTGALIKASQRFPDNKYRPRDPDLLSEALDGRKATRHLPKAMYLGHAFPHFGHFLVETIPNLYWVREADPNTPLLFHPFDFNPVNVFTDRAHGVTALKLLGLPADRFVMADGDITVGALALPPRAYDIHNGPRFDFRTVYSSLREAALVGQSGPSLKHVYLSRRRLRPRLRRLEDERSVERRMARRGFTILYPEHMSFLDQIRAVAEADIVAGIDGSALHLSAFMRPRAKMLILETRRRRNVLALNALMEVETISVATTPPAQGARYATLDHAKLDSALDALSLPPAMGALRYYLKRLFKSVAS